MNILFYFDQWIHLLRYFKRIACITASKTKTLYKS